MNILENNPSLLMLPSAVKEGKLYSIVPQDGSGDFTVERNCEASRTNKEGNIEIVPANTPRIDYSTGEPMLLVEGQSTNLIKWSEDFSDVSWDKLSSGTGLPPSVTSGFTAPDGTFSAYKVDFNKGEGTTTGDYSLLSEVIQVNETPHKSSVYVKSLSGIQKILFYRISTVWEVIEIGENWTRIEVDPLLSPTVYFRLGLRGGHNNEISQSSFLIWGAQLEEGSKATSYIPTNGSIATRLADEITVTPPTGTTEIKETVNGEENVITTIPATYQIPNGNISKIEMV